MRGWAAAALAVFVAVAGCAPVPQPFRPADDAPANPLLEIADIPGIYVTAVEGTTAPMGRLLARAVADALNERDVPAYVNPPKTRRYLLAGRVDSAVEGTWVVRWRLLDPHDTVVAEHEELVDVPAWRWEYGDPRLLDTIGAHVAATLVKVARPEDPSLQPVPEPAALSVHVGPVEGAPGDGNTSLRRAVRASLGLAKVPLSDRKDGAAVLTAKVEVGAARNGTQPIRIIWRLDDADGARIGEAAQENGVPQGSLDGPWGEIAGYAADAAVEGILELIAAAGSGPVVPAPPAPGLPPPPARPAPAARR